jgi:benzoyl-CoA reductase/2-hydroxyglutaryl-CoA dehydratase subunit BcrC/BadD/HgdB
VENKARGNFNIGTFCIYVPDEIPMAVDAIPIPLCGGTNFTIPYSEQAFPRDICPLIKSTLGLSMSGTCPYKAVKQMTLGETTCDAKKKTWDILAGKMNFYVMEVPQKKNHIDAQLWHQAVVEFKDKVEELTGKQVNSEALAKQIKIMNAKRSALQKFTEFRKMNPPFISGLDALLVMQMALNADPKYFTEKLNLLNSELKRRAEKNNSPFTSKAKRIMVSGCPSVMGNWKVHSLIEQSGAVVVVDETCTGTKYFENLIDESPQKLDKQLQAIADRYFMINCSCFTPNDARIQDVCKKAEEFKVQGVIHYILQTCHTYNLEAQRLEGALKQKQIPSLKIITDYSEEDTEQLRTRIEAFLETL